jgi:hypothetical protein
MTIMTQTLPTVVGMGVVSRAVDTTFGQRGRGAPRKKSKPAAKKSKGPKVYTGPRGGKYILRKGRKVYI